MNIKDIRENYRDFDDYQIIKIATEEANSLKLEVIEILKNEITRRNLDNNLLISINSQTNELSEAQFEEYCSILRNSPCPNCKSKTGKIHVSVVGKVFSALIITNYEKNLRAACSDCLDDMHRKANTNNILLGWWAFPWGPIQTIRSFIFNSDMKSNNRTKQPNDLFKSFVLENIGIIAASKNDTTELMQFLDKTNRRV